MARLPCSSSLAQTHHRAPSVLCLSGPRRDTATVRRHCIWEHHARCVLLEDRHLWQSRMPLDVYRVGAAARRQPGLLFRYQASDKKFSLFFFNAHCIASLELVPSVAPTLPGSVCMPACDRECQTCSSGTCMNKPKATKCSLGNCRSGLCAPGEGLLWSLCTAWKEWLAMAASSFRPSRGATLRHTAAQILHTWCQTLRKISPLGLETNTGWPRHALNWRRQSLPNGEGCC